MDELDKLFPKVIGQKNVKKKLAFYIESQNKTGLFNPILISGSFGSGKNSLTMALARNLKRKNENAPKTFIEFNCASIKKVSELFDDVLIPHIFDKEITLNLDEVHKATEEIQVVLLSLLNPNPNHKNTYNYQGNTYEVDFYNQSFILTTSEPNQLLTALLNRLDKVETEDYSLEDLSKIISKNLSEIEINDELLIQMASVSRSNAREAFSLSGNVRKYIELNNLKYINQEHWNDIKYRLNIRPLGLNNIEFKIISILKKTPNLSLTKLSSILNLSPESVRRFYEKYLLSQNLMEIVTPRGRKLTAFGQKYAEEVKN